MLPAKSDESSTASPAQLPSQPTQATPTIPCPVTWPEHKKKPKTINCTIFICLLHYIIYAWQYIWNSSELLPQVWFFLDTNLHKVFFNWNRDDKAKMTLEENYVVTSYIWVFHVYALLLLVKHSIELISTIYTVITNTMQGINIQTIHLILNQIQNYSEY